MFINRKLPFLAHSFDVKIKRIRTRCINVGFGEYGELWQDVGRYGERLLKKLATNFVSQYSARII